MSDLFLGKTASFGGGGTAYGGSTAAMAVDGDDSSSSSLVITDPVNGVTYVQVDVGAVVTLQALRLHQPVPTQRATIAYLEGSSDGSTFLPIQTFSDIIGYGSFRVNIVQTTPYRYYRLRLGVCTGAYWRVASLEGRDVAYVADEPGTDGFLNKLIGFTDGSEYQPASWTVDGDEATAGVLQSPVNGSSSYVIDTIVPIALSHLHIKEPTISQYAGLFYVEAGSNTTEWVTLATITQSEDGVHEYALTGTTPYRFYRMRLGTLVGSGFWTISSLVGTVATPVLNATATFMIY